MIGIRLDSGDLAWLSIEARRILDAGGFPDARILASNDLDEHIINSLKEQGARIDVWGVGTKLATAYDQPALGGVYKLSALRDGDGRWQYKLKLSEQAAKISNPGVLQVRRFRSPAGRVHRRRDLRRGAGPDAAADDRRSPRPHPPPGDRAGRRRTRTCSSPFSAAGGWSTTCRPWTPSAPAPAAARRLPRRHQALRQPPPIPRRPRTPPARAEDRPDPQGPRLRRPRRVHRESWNHEGTKARRGESCPVGSALRTAPPGEPAGFPSAAPGRALLSSCLRVSLSPCLLAVSPCPLVLAPSQNSVSHLTRCNSHTMLV